MFPVEIHFYIEEGDRNVLRIWVSKNIPTQNFISLNNVTVMVESLDVVLAEMRSKLTMDGFQFLNNDHGDPENMALRRWQMPDYMSLRGLRMYIRQWLNTFDEVEIWKEKEGLNA